MHDKSITRKNRAEKVVGEGGQRGHNPFVFVKLDTKGFLKRIGQLWCEAYLRDTVKTGVGGVPGEGILTPSMFATS